MDLNTKPVISHKKEGEVNSSGSDKTGYARHITSQIVKKGGYFTYYLSNRHKSLKLALM